MPTNQSQVQAIVEGMMVDRYRIVRKIGEGGFGEVFEAEQLEPVHRRVALKLILQGMNTKEVIARFDAERQALAMMEHPNIAKVFDAGATSSGQPFFVMELVVDGVPINQYCDDHKLSIAARLRLIAQACAAIQHAHGKGIVHRDLKPGNILVCDMQGEMTVKVIDFGVAKAISGRLTDLSLVTKVHQIVGTLQYMSPEQISGSLDIDTRTDVYALGAVLYEVLTGQTPLALEESGGVLAELQRMIRDIEPIRPSSRVSGNQASLNTRAAQCSSSPGKLKELMRGELDWIVMKALDKERAKRYETTSALAADLQRYLDGQPVLAVPPSRWYRFQKLVRRNKLVFGAAASVFVALAAGVVGFAWQARISNQRAAELTQVVEFQKEMLKKASPEEAGKLLDAEILGKYKSALALDQLSPDAQSEQLLSFQRQWQRINATDAARDFIETLVLKPSVAAIEIQFTNQPAIAATLRQAMADRYYEIGKYEISLSLSERALDYRQRYLGLGHSDTLGSMSNIATTLMAIGRTSDAKDLTEKVYKGRVDLLGEQDADTVGTLLALGGANEQLGNYEEALKQLEKAVAQFRKIQGENGEWTLSALNSLAALHYRMGNTSTAQSLWEQALEGMRAAHGDVSVYTIAVYNNLGTIAYELGDFAKAKDIYRTAYTQSKTVSGENHPDTLFARNNLAASLYAVGRLDEAESIRLKVLNKRRELLGNESVPTLMSVNDMGTLRRVQGRLAEAETYAREFLTNSERTLSEKSQLVHVGLSNLGAILLLQDQLEEAEPLFQRSLLLNRDSTGAESSGTLMAIVDLASLRNAQNRAAEARDLLAPIEQIVRRTFAGARGIRIAIFLRELGIANTALDELPLAEQLLLESYKIFSSLPAPSMLPKEKCAAALAALYAKLHLQQPIKGFDQKAKEWLTRAQASLSAP